ncbi:hypothetical protein ANOM_002005 [Aspergillus nomiae NRRL 13137]|uniref:Uncharacterized protein n=1 Tax=Aspergillus nomiae NRRL (strain ATCC 15546 / NRRL 13137 / CBS 260.88 / M93) TaxID=1509407 RepID=A0A0L1JEC2_ASPN3|nr:uncharacterized protein ANOM_002005 [Aspergillus nomiae NRRL 13137]KNG89758.1 hypothetical protein ANOM_002005 [Aspergillus nomiae NRRL 13137]
MLLRFLSVTGAFFLSSCAALSLPEHKVELSGLDPEFRSRIISNARPTNVPTALCSFSNTECSKDIDLHSHLTLDFSTENGTLLANHDPIFHPLSQCDSMQFGIFIRAERLSTWPMNSILFDLQGRPASDHLVTITVTQDSEGNLQITQLETNPIHGHHHPDGPPSWMAQLTASIQAMKDAVKDCMHGPGPKHATARPQHGHMQQPPVDKHRTIAPEHHPYHHRPGYWAGREKNFGRLMRPVVMPALLGVVAGVVACMVGFVMGKIIISVFYCVRGCRKQKKQREQEQSSIPRIVVVESASSEKERLLAMCDDRC